MTRYLLDTDSIIDYLYGIRSTITLLRQLDAQGHQLCTSDVVVCEVYTGLLPRHRPTAEALFDAMEYLPTSRQAAQRAGDWRARHRAQGQQLAATDCLIAATAHEHGAQVVTRNVKDFPMPEVTLLPLAQPSP